MKIQLIDIKSMNASDPKAAEGLARLYSHNLSMDGLMKDCFYDGSVYNFGTFFKLCLDKSNIFMLVWDDDIKQMIAHIYLCGFEGLVCRAHFGVLRLVHGREYTVNMGKEVVKQVFNLKRKSGQYPVTSTLVGLTPVMNRMACSFVKAMGFKEVAILTDACYISYMASYHKGMLSILSK